MGGGCKGGEVLVTDANALSAEFYAKLLPINMLLSGLIWKSTHYKIFLEFCVGTRPFLKPAEIYFIHCENV